MNHYLLPLRADSTLSQRRMALVIVLSAMVSTWTAAPKATACPFCSATAQTLSEEIQSADVAVLAKMVPLGKTSELAAKDKPEAGEEQAQSSLPSTDPDTGMATFQINHIIRGAETLGAHQQLQVVYFGDYQPNKTFLISGITNTGLGGSSLAVAAGEKKAASEKPRIDWSTPLPLSQEGAGYVKQLTALPAKGSDRLLYFMKYLEHNDPLLAQDSYDEFARAPYEQILKLDDQMDRNQLVAWINDPQVGPTRRRLYLTMLGVCGQGQDIEMLESLLQYDYRQIQPGVAAMVSFAGLAGSAIGLPIVDELVKAEARRKKQCLDALVACYLKLKGPAGLALIEQQFLSNPATEYTHVYATIMALRFHGEETDVIPKQRLLQSLRLVLDNSEIADQVIPDLTRWEDWEVMDRLVTMFKTSDSDGWIRQPVISYLVVAAEQTGEVGSRAKKALTELEQLDPKTVERARSLMAFSGFGRATSSAAKTAEDPAAELADPQEKVADQNEPKQQNENKSAEQNESTQAEQAVSDSTIDSAEINKVVENLDIEKTNQQVTQDSHASQDSEPPQDSESPQGTEPSESPQESPSQKSEPAPKGVATEPPSRLTMIGVPLIAGLILMGIFAVLLRGSDFRETD